MADTVGGDGGDSLQEMWGLTRSVRKQAGGTTAGTGGERLRCV